MKRWWETQAARINALSLRERAFLFLSVIACCMALADVLWLSPAQLAHKQLSQRFEKQSAELQRTRDALKTVARPSDTGGATREEMAAVAVRLDAVNQTIQTLLPTPTKSAPLAQVLEQLLRRHAGLTLLRTTVVAPEPAGKSTPGAANAPTSTGLMRQGVEFTVSGPYAELTRYVLALEQALPSVRWGPMKLVSEKQPPELTLQLFVVGVAP